MSHRYKNPQSSQPSNPKHAPAKGLSTVMPPDPVKSMVSQGTIRLNRKRFGTFYPDTLHHPLITLDPELTPHLVHGEKIEVTHPGDYAIATSARYLDPTYLVVGRAVNTPRGWMISPTDGRYNPILADGAGIQGLEQGALVVATFNRQTKQGKLTEVLAAPGDDNGAIEAIIHQAGLTEEFPDDVIAEVEAYNEDSIAKAIPGRTDCREQHVITIDPEDAKDFDDAIYLEKHADGWKVWVHIADVSHYVKPGTALDREALERGNSTYLVDRVIPMLPPILSDKLCSLQPRVDRLTKAIEFDLSPEGHVLAAKVHEAAIHSKHRFSYEQAFAVIEKGTAANPSEAQVLLGHELATKLRSLRQSDGAFDLNFPEYKIKLDAAGRFASAHKVTNDASHQLIEEFMLLANEAVATLTHRKGRKTIHRVHEQPDEVRLQELRQELIAEGIPCSNLAIRDNATQLLKQYEGTGVTSRFLRCLKRARYSLESLGHYGLAKKFYTHFTSPIRRYADLVVHRDCFSTDIPHNHESVAAHISNTERVSSDAESSSKKVKIMQYLNSLSQSGAKTVFEADVVDLIKFGMFVELTELGVSGLVHVKTLPGYWELQGSKLVERRSGNTYQLRDKIKVRVAKVDLAQGQVDFMPA